MSTDPPSAPEKPTLLCRTAAEWVEWLEENHATSGGVWLRMGKKASGVQTVSYPEAVDGALCYGWIDGQSKSEGEKTWLQKFTPRMKKSIWSKINREKVAALLERGLMRAAGFAEVERARLDGRWEAAYDSPSTAEVPPDLEVALSRSARAKEFFATLSSQNRYAILFRLQTAKKPETRAKRIDQFVAMLERSEKFHP